LICSGQWSAPLAGVTQLSVDAFIQCGQEKVFTTSAKKTRSAKRSGTASRKGRAFTKTQGLDEAETLLDAS
jgi:hypothetical protein